MKLIIGIGNPGKKYERTRHNVGFAVLDALAERCQASAWREDKDLGALLAKAGKAWLLKPLSFVNLTGEVAAAAVEKLAPEDLLFVCDDVNLRFGKMRLRPSGSAGGHHGLESAVEWLNGGNFSRLRIGVQNERMPKDDVAGFVLEKFSSGERKELESVLKKAAGVCEAWAGDGFEAAQNKLSRTQAITGVSE